MGRRRDNENPVSLFAFQDIITSITGIMILVVLLLILDILDSKEEKAPSPYKEDIVKLEATVKNLREKLDEESKWLDKNEEWILKAASMELSLLPKLIEKEKKKFLLLAATLKSAQEENINTQSLIAATTAKTTQINSEIKDATVDVNIQKGVLDKKTDTLNELKKKLENLKKEEKSRSNQVEIRTAADLKLTPIFVECSDSMIKTKNLKTTEIKNFTSDPGDKLALLRIFFTWLKRTRDPSNESVVVIVKPSAVGSTSQLLGILRDAGFSYNIEPMDEDKTGVYK